MSSPTQNITEGVIWKQLLSYFFPILLGTFFQQLYNTVDTIVVGRYVGTHALAAVGAASPLISLVTGFFVGLSSGATVLVSQRFGAGDRKGVRDAIHSGMALAILMGAVITVLGLVGSRTVLGWMHTPAENMDDAVRYAWIYFCGSVSSMVYNMGAGILRAMGDSRRPTVFLAITCILNVLGDLFFVLVLGMDVGGVALATALSQTVSAVLVLLTLAKLPRDIAFRPGQLKLSGKLLGVILGVGIPAGLQMTSFDLAGTLIQSGVNTFGETTVAAWIAFYKTDFLSWMVAGAFGVSVTTFVGQNFGAGHIDRVKRSVWVCIGISMVIQALISALELGFRFALVGIYTTDTEVIRLAARLMMITVPFNLIYMPQEVFAGAMRGTGHAVVPTVIMLICICLYRVLWVLTVVKFYHYIEVLALCYPISWILADIALYIAYLRSNWLKKPMKM